MICWRLLFESWVLEAFLYCACNIITTVVYTDSCSPLYLLRPRFWCLVPSLFATAAVINEPGDGNGSWAIAFQISCGIVIIFHMIFDYNMAWVPLLILGVIEFNLWRFFPLVLCGLLIAFTWNERDFPTLMLCVATGATTASWVWTTLALPSVAPLILAAIGMELVAVVMEGTRISHSYELPRDWKSTHWSLHVLFTLVGIKCVDAHEWQSYVSQRNSNALSEYATGMWWIDSEHGLPVAGRLMHAVNVAYEGGKRTLVFRNIYADQFCYRYSFMGALWCYADGCSLPMSSRMYERDNQLLCDGVYLFSVRLPRYLSRGLGLDTTMELGDACVKHTWSRCRPEVLRKVFVPMDSIHRRLVHGIILVYLLNTREC